MKIVQVCPRYAPRTGGVERHVKEISERLIERGHEVVVHTADAGSDVENDEVRNGVTVRRHRGCAPDGAFHVAPGIATAVRREEGDIVHAHNYHSLPLFFAALGVRDERFVVTTHYHGASADSFRNRLLSLYRPFGRWAVRRADEVIAVSDWERDRLVVDFGVDATVIPNGLDVERFRSAEPVDFDDPYLLCVGRLEKYKGVQHVIRALPELPDVRLKVAGSGPYREPLERVAREHDVKDRIDFLGYVDEERLPELYTGATAYVSLSEFESYGMTVGEALVSGTPCVIRAKTALEKWAAFDGCTVVESVTPGEVGTAIQEVQEQKVDTTHVSSWTDVADDVLAVYRSE